MAANPAPPPPHIFRTPNPDYKIFQICRASRYPTYRRCNIPCLVSKSHITSQKMHIITIQDTFLDVIGDVENKKIASESIWIGRRDTQDEENSEHYDVSVSMDKGKLTFAAPDGAHISMHRKGPLDYCIGIVDESGEHSYPLKAPKSSLGLGLKQRVSASAISPDGTRLIVGTEAGDILQYDTTTQLLLGKISGAHLADITKIIVLPSSKVMITVGADLQTKLWPVGAGSEASPARIFSAQKAAITDVVEIDRGRNFLTASRDGSALLWECSTAQVVSRFRRIDNLNDPATCMALCEGKEVGPGDTVGGDLLHGCQNAYVFVGYQSGTIQQFSVAGHFQTGVKFHRSAEVTSLKTESPYLIAGYADGVLRVYDVSETNGAPKNASKFWELQLNPNFAIDRLGVKGRGSGASKLKVVVSNGPELLVEVSFDGASFHCTQLVGLSEMFRAVQIDCSGDKVFVTTGSEIVQY